MKKTLMILAISAGVIFAGCGAKQTEEAAMETPTETPAETPAEQPAAVNTTHAYICPMNCEGSPSMEPGNCPVCGMALVENPDYAASGETTEAAASATDAGHDHEDHEGHDH